MAFAITYGDGFHVVFDNGVTVSVQFGGANYCQHYDRDADYKGEPGKSLTSVDAETAAWDVSGKWITPEFANDQDMLVLGWQSAEQVLALLNWASKYHQD